VISLLQRPLPDNTQHSQQTNIHAPDGIQTHNPSRRVAVDPRLRSRGHWKWLIHYIVNPVTTKLWDKITSWVNGLHRKLNVLKTLWKKFKSSINQGIRVHLLAGAFFFFFFTPFRPVLGAQPASHQISTRGPSGRSKQKEQQADHLLPSRGKIKNVWSYAITPPYIFMAWCLINHRDNFIFLPLHENSFSLLVLILLYCIVRRHEV
jgi:hypothetical protein